MATSGSVDFTLNRDEVIRSAYELVGVAVEGESLQPEEITVAGRALNVQLKAMTNYGLQLWKRDTQTITLTANQASYTIGRSGTPDLTADRPIRVLEATIVGNGTVDSGRTSLVRTTKNEYVTLEQTTTGTPTQFLFEPGIDNATLSLWPVPDSTAATNEQVEIVVQTYLEDVDSSADNLDCPSEWLEAIIYGLAVRLAPRTALDLQSRVLLSQEADKILDLALSYDVEDESLYLYPSEV